MPRLAVDRSTLPLVNAFECLECGNPRGLLPEVCPYCGSAQPPFAHTDFATINLERGLPVVEDALQRLDTFIRAGFDAGLKWLLVLHGYGSSGQGGRIRLAVRADLAANRWAERVREAYPGEAVANPSDLNLARSGSRDGLFPYLVSRRLVGNAGVTILLMHTRRA